MSIRSIEVAVFLIDLFGLRCGIELILKSLIEHISLWYSRDTGESTIGIEMPLNYVLRV